MRTLKSTVTGALRPSLLFVLALTLAGCGETEISGEVFIVTKSRENIRLGRTSVYVMDAGELNRLQSEAEADRQASLESARQKVHAEESRVEQTRKMLETNIASLEQDLKRQDRKLYETNPFGTPSINAGKTTPEERRSYEQASALRNEVAAELEKTRRDLEVALLPLQKASEELASAKLRTISVIDLIARAIEINSTLGHAKTDSHGKFSITVPGRDKYSICASDSRQVAPDNTENYQWIIEVVPKARSATATLSSDNLWPELPGT